jgi:hypothetical protein
MFILRAITNTAWREGSFSVLQQEVNIVTTVFLKVKWQIFVVVCKKQTLFLLPYLSFLSYFLIATLSNVYSDKMALRCNIFLVGAAFDSSVNNAYFVFFLRLFVNLYLTHATERQIVLLAE